MPISLSHNHFIGNYANQSELLREQYVQNVTIIQNDVQFEIRNASRAMWACDPNDFYNQGNHNNIQFEQVLYFCYLACPKFLIMLPFHIVSICDATGTRVLH